jgi:hypothetical protein
MVYPSEHPKNIKPNIRHIRVPINIFNILHPSLGFLYISLNIFLNILDLSMEGQMGFEPTTLGDLESPALTVRATGPFVKYLVTS